MSYFKSTRDRRGKLLKNFVPAYNISKPLLTHGHLWICRHSSSTDTATSSAVVPTHAQHHSFSTFILTCKQFAGENP